MLRFLKLLFWVVVVGAGLVASDQVLVRVPLESPGVSQLQNFYVDFRRRLLALAGIEGGQPESIEGLIESTVAAPAVQTGTSRRYLYVDESGTLQFADSLAEVPLRYRQEAQPLAE